MESKLDLIATDPPFNTGKAFNRTSMESKRNHIRTITDITQLLIEPVWNRNCFSSYVSKSDYLTFNRTSMESKPDAVTYLIDAELFF